MFKVHESTHDQHTERIFEFQLHFKDNNFDILIEVTYWIWKLDHLLRGCRGTQHIVESICQFMSCDDQISDGNFQNL